MVFMPNWKLTFFLQKCYLCCWHLLYIPLYDKRECQVTAVCPLWFPVTFRLEKKALLVNYYAKWGHRKITASSTEVNIFSFFAALGRPANSEGPELPLTFSELEFSSAISHSRSRFYCKQQVSSLLFLHHYLLRNKKWTQVTYSFPNWLPHT